MKPMLYEIKHIKGLKLYSLLLLISVNFYINNDVCAQWLTSTLPTPGNIQSIKFTGNRDIFAQQLYTYFPTPQTSAANLYFYKSTDYGITWNAKYTYIGYAGENWSYCDVSFLNQSTGIFIHSNYPGTKLFRTTNGGDNWSFNFIPFSSGYYPRSCSLINDSIVIVLMEYPGNGFQIFRTSNSGLNWSINPPPASGQLTKIYFINQNLGFITAGNGIICRSTDLGLNWQSINTGVSNNIYDISFCDNLIGFAVGYSTQSQPQSVILRTSNAGFNWSTCYSASDNYLKSVSCSNPYTIYCSGYSLLKTTNSGNNWTQILNNGSFAYVSSLNKDTLVVASGNTVFRSFNGGNVFIRKLDSEIPDKFVLSQNYPNPFNPVTKISFTLPENGFAVLKIYDIRGIEVAAPVNEELSAGKYEINFNASGLASGTYFYKLEYTSKNGIKSSQTKKLVVLK